MKLKKGVNKVLVKINNGTIPPELYFTVVAVQELNQREVKYSRWVQNGFLFTFRET